MSALSDAVSSKLATLKAERANIETEVDRLTISAEVLDAQIKSLESLAKSSGDGETAPFAQA